MFLPSPSMFQDIALKEEKEGFLVTEASATGADLSGHLSLKNQWNLHHLGIQELTPLPKQLTHRDSSQSLVTGFGQVDRN